MLHKEDDDKDKKKPKKAEQIHQAKDDVSPDIKTKLREMLTAELNKKLDELDLAPSLSSTKSTSAVTTSQGKSTGDSTELKQGSSNPNAYSKSSKQAADSTSFGSNKKQGSTLGKLSRQQKQFSTSSSNNNDNEVHKGSSNPNNNQGDDTTMLNNAADEKIPSAKKVKNANSQFSSDDSKSSSFNNNQDQSDFLEEKSLLAKSIKKAKGTVVTGVLRSKGTERKADRCKRYRILKNGKKLKLKFHKKDCIEPVRGKSLLNGPFSIFFGWQFY